MELARSKRIYSAYLCHVVSAARDGVNIDIAPADMWSPPGDIRIVGARVSAQINVGAPADLNKTVAYHYAEVSLSPKMAQCHQIAIAWAHIEVVELPTAGEHTVLGHRAADHTVFFPQGEGFSTNEWHPVYLSMMFRNRFPDIDLEMAANATIYYVEL